MVNNKKQYLSYLNDMELINGYLYINLFTYPTIIKVDYKTGEVVKRYNLS
jgi:glutamine cyclotransferase